MRAVSRECHRLPCVRRVPDRAVLAAPKTCHRLKPATPRPELATAFARRPTADPSQPAAPTHLGPLPLHPDTPFRIRVPELGFHRTGHPLCRSNELLGALFLAAQVAPPSPPRVKNQPPRTWIAGRRGSPLEARFSSCGILNAETVSGARLRHPEHAVHAVSEHCGRMPRTALCDSRGNAAAKGTAQDVYVIW